LTVLRCSSIKGRGFPVLKISVFVENKVERPTQGGAPGARYRRLSLTHDGNRMFDAELLPPVTSGE
jgi:hypothetical protein